MHFNPPSPCGEGRKYPLPNVKICYFNPPSPCGEGLNTISFQLNNTNFNPPSPCGEGPVVPEPCGRGRPRFQSTLSVWRGTAALRRNQRDPSNFNPPSPCGEGPHTFNDPKNDRKFQSTLSVWRGTLALTCRDVNNRISIHPLRVERDNGLFTPSPGP